MTKKYTTEEFIFRANKVHNNKYNYSKTIYDLTSTKIIITCTIHGDFTQTPNNHLRKRGCPKCKIETVKNKQRHTLERFIEKAIIVHGKRYNYSKSNYINNMIKIIIICSEHGEFQQYPNNHLAGKGCRKCGGSYPKSFNSFVREANLVHKNKYTYLSKGYNGAHSKITIICPNHGEFQQCPGSHLHQKHGCPSCGKWNFSKLENQWLDFLKISKEYRQYKLTIGNRRFIVDGFNPKINTVYEFYGDYWHGNPKIYPMNKLNATRKCTFKELYQKTKTRELVLKNAGYNLITVWESDYHN